jgi:dynein heavy chain, axonemal
MLERQRIVNFDNPARESFTIHAFLNKQKEVRNAVVEKIREVSLSNRRLFKAGVDATIQKLIDRFEKRKDPTSVLLLEQSAKPIEATDADEFQLKQREQDKKHSQLVASDPLYEQLGFKGYMPYQARKEVREACQMFLRWSFLYDFIALESLSEIYTQSIQDSIETLRRQSSLELSYSFEDTAAPVQASGTDSDGDDKPKFMMPQIIPTFKAEIHFRYRKNSEMAHALYEEEVESFQLPPVGKSKKEDFNPMVHLEIESDDEEDDNAEGNKAKGEGDAASDDEESDNSNAGAAGAATIQYYRPPTEEELYAQAKRKKYKLLRVNEIQSQWLALFPDQDNISQLLQQAL